MINTITKQHWELIKSYIGFLVIIISPWGFLVCLYSWNIQVDNNVSISNKLELRITPEISATKTARWSSHSGGLEVNDNPSHALPDKQPGTSAASNQRRAFLKPPRVAVGRIHSVHDNLPATISTHVSIKTSFTMSHNPPCCAWTRRTKGFGPESTSAPLNVTSLRQRWLYIYFRIDRQSTCQLFMTKRTMGNYVRCLAHFLTLIARSLRSLTTAYL